MKSKKSVEADLVTAYRAGAERRRAQGYLRAAISQMHKYLELDSEHRGGVVKIRIPADAKTVGSLGGATKVFGRSRISVPGLGVYVKRLMR